MEANPQAVEDPKKKWWQISNWRCKCALWCSLARFPLEPKVPTMVSTINTHYPYGFFIKEIVIVSNLLCWDKFGKDGLCMSVKLEL
jgi:hypothetical protein